MPHINLVSNDKIDFMQSKKHEICLHGESVSYDVCLKHFRIVAAFSGSIIHDGNSNKFEKKIDLRFKMPSTK